MPKLSHPTRPRFWAGFRRYGSKLGGPPALPPLIYISIKKNYKIDHSFRIDSNLKVEFGAFEYNRKFYTKIYCSAHSYINVSVLCALESQFFVREVSVSALGTRHMRSRGWHGSLQNWWFGDRQNWSTHVVYRLCVGCMDLQFLLRVGHMDHICYINLRIQTYFLGMCARVLAILERQKEGIIGSIMTND
jgi:hypothetical protein